MRRLIDKLADVGACLIALEALEKLKLTPAAYWRTSQRGEWMLWLVIRVGLWTEVMDAVSPVLRDTYSTLGELTPDHVTNVVIDGRPEHAANVTDDFFCGGKGSRNRRKIVAGILQKELSWAKVNRALNVAAKSAREG